MVLRALEESLAAAARYMAGSGWMDIVCFNSTGEGKGKYRNGDLRFKEEK